MFIYNYRAFDLYNKPVISLAILGDDSKKWRPNSYEYGLGKSKLKLEFSIIKLQDYVWEELEESNNIFAILVMAHLKRKPLPVIYQKGNNGNGIYPVYFTKKVITEKK